MVLDIVASTELRQIQDVAVLWGPVRVIIIGV